MTGRRTNRLFELQAQDSLSESFEHALDQIAENGVTTIHVIADEESMSWSYSTGMYDTWGQPEIVMIGFPSRLASSILESIVELNDTGQFLKGDQRIPGLIKRCDCIFRPVDEVWVRRLMLRTMWFYGNDITFPVLQCICPDFHNHFPWEDGFDSAWRPRQALLQKGIIKTEAERKLWNVSGSDINN